MVSCVIIHNRKTINKSQRRKHSGRFFGTMLYKRCSRCGARIAVGSSCTCVNKRYAAERRQETDKENKFYSSAEWKKLRLQAIDYYFALDIYSYYKNNLIEFGETVHHIIPIREDFDKRNDIKNLIFLTESNHQRIHELMKKSEAEKMKILKDLKMLQNRFAAEFYA